MSTFILKIIAMLCMLIDHISRVLWPSQVTIYSVDFSTASSELIRNATIYTIGRGIGRIAFPIFCFLLVEGIMHTGNLKKYAIRLGILAVLSEIPFDMMVYGKYSTFAKQNVVFTLLLGFAAVSFIRYVQKRWPGDMLKYNTFSCMTILVCGCAAMFFATDYSMFGVLLIVTFYIFRDKKALAAIMMLVLMAAFSSETFLLDLPGLLAFPLLYFYNEKKGIEDKHAFYAFYPLHMLILGLLRIFVL